MKKLFPIALIALFAALTIMPSCKKSDSSPSKSLSATINGTSFTANNVLSFNYGGSVFIYGTNGKSEFDLTIDTFSTTPKTYTISASSVQVEAFYNADTTNQLGGHVFDSGSVVVTAASSNSVKGTFTLYSRADTVTATGSFSGGW